MYSFYILELWAFAYFDTQKVKAFYNSSLYQELKHAKVIEVIQNADLKFDEYIRTNTKKQMSWLI